MFTPNYPDFLGKLTNGARCNVGALQLALAITPRVVRAGRNFAAILFAQNATDGDVDLTATVKLPHNDAKNQPNQFKSKAQRLVIGLRPAEVGYVLLPVMCQNSTAVHEGYKLGVNVVVKSSNKAAVIRAETGGGELGKLSPKIREELKALHSLHFSTHKAFGLGTTLETTFSVMPGKISKLVDLSPGWISLWTMSDYTALVTAKTDELSI